MNPQVFDLWLWVTWWLIPTQIQLWHFEIEIPMGTDLGHSWVHSCSALTWWDEYLQCKAMAHSHKFYLACLTCANRPFRNHWIQGICSDCNNSLFGLFAMCKPMISEPLVYRLYVWCAITFYLACLTCVNQWFLNHWYIGYMFGVKSHFIWHVWDVQSTISDPGL